MMILRLQNVFVTYLLSTNLLHEQWALVDILLSVICIVKSVSDLPVHHV